MPDDLVPHPRYGSCPRMTHLEYRGDEPGANLGWKYSSDKIIPGTGIVADKTKQHGSVMPIFIYFDVLKECVDCSRPFLFFAEEQRHWFEMLGFPNDADCVRCVPCRKQEQKNERLNQEYQRLVGLRTKSASDHVELAKVALDMHAIGRLGSLEKLRRYFNRIPESEHHRMSYRRIKARMKMVEHEARTDG